MDKKNLAETKEFLEQNGYCVVSDVFSEQEIFDFRSSFDEVVERASEQNLVIRNHDDNILVKGDLAGQKEFHEFDYFIFNKKIVQIAKDLIGSDPIYFGESNMQSGVGDRGFHSDNRKIDRESLAGEDWKGDYNLIRIAIYLHPSDNVSGGIKIVPGSHKIPTSRFLFGHKNIKANIGDVVIWKLTTTHSGNAKRIKFFNWLSIHPRLEKFVPLWAENQNTLSRKAMFIVYAGAGNHYDRYLEYFNSREDYTEYQLYSGNSTELDSLAEEAGVKRIIPSQKFGSKY